MEDRKTAQFEADGSDNHTLDSAGGEKVAYHDNHTPDVNDDGEDIDNDALWAPGACSSTWDMHTELVHTC